MPDAWLKGPVSGVPPALQPVAHGLLNVRIEVEAVLRDAQDAEVWQRPAGVAPVAFHVRHLCGSVDRLLTYARGQALTGDQLAVLADERNAEPRLDVAALRRLLSQTIERAIEQLRTTPESALDEPRGVGRQQLPSTVRGLLFHAAEHGARHAGQAVTTMKLVREKR